MKIETLLRAYTFCTIDRLTCIPNSLSDSIRNILDRRSRQREAIRKGIIRKFERLERKLNSELVERKLASAAFEKAWNDFVPEKNVNTATILNIKEK